MITWEDFQKLCEDIKQNPGNYTWVVLDPVEGVSFRKGNEDDKLWVDEMIGWRK